MVAFNEIEVDETQRLLRVQRERRNRRDVCYLITDRLGDRVLLTQKLYHAIDHLNKVATHPIERVSFTQLYLIAQDETKGFHKLRWKVEKLSFSDVIARFESVRKVGYKHAIILGDKRCYDTGVHV